MLSIVIVTWNSESEIINCLDSIYKDCIRSGIQIEIIIVDNNSTDRTVEIIKDKNYENMTIICNDNNLGYTKACNQGMKSSKGDFVLLLNPDTEVKANSVKELLNSIENIENCGAVAPKLLNKNGTVQESCRNFPTYRDMFFELSVVFKKSSNWKLSSFNPVKPKQVDQPMAAALLIKKKILTVIEYMDERFEMFFNDVDLCKKIYLSGYKIMYIPTSEVIHEKGVSIYKDRKRMIKIWNSDCIKYFKKYFGISIKLKFLEILLNLSLVIRK